MRQALVVFALACAAAALAASVPDTFYATGITLNNVTKAVKQGQPVLFGDSQPGPDGAYQLHLQLKNADSKTVAVQSLITTVYIGSFVDAIPSGAAPLLTLPVQVSQK
jgi:hypothetical protein